MYNRLLYNQLLNWPSQGQTLIRQSFEKNWSLFCPTKGKLLQLRQKLGSHGTARAFRRISVFEAILSDKGKTSPVTNSLRYSFCITSCWGWTQEYRSLSFSYESLNNCEQVKHSSNLVKFLVSVVLKVFACGTKCDIILGIIKCWQSILLMLSFHFIEKLTEMQLSLSVILQ